MLYRNIPTNKYNKGNIMQDKKNTEQFSTPKNKVLTEIKYNLALSLALSLNVNLSTNVTINTARVLPYIKK